MTKKKRKCNGNDDLRSDKMHPLMTRLDGLIDRIKDTFQRQDDGIPDGMKKTLNDDLTAVIGSCEKLLQNSEEAAGNYLHNLPQEKPNLAEVKKVIGLFPNALLHENGKGEIPIQKNGRTAHGVRYVSLLAEEASRRKIGSERGGLLLPITTSSRDYNILQYLIASRSNYSPYENDCLQALKDLHRAKLFLDIDFNQFNLINAANWQSSIKRLDYLVNVYPASLSKPLPSGDYPIHLSNHLERKHVGVFSKLLEAGMEHYPESFGFLFNKRNGNGERAINQAIDQYGKKETLKIIQRLIPSTDNNPILHHVFRYTPRLAEDFVYMYPNAVALKDKRGRYLLHVAVKRGLKMSSYLLMMIHCDKQCLEEKDPVTNLYPFMLAATSGFKKDLTTIYNLLCYRPDIISNCLGIGDEDDEVE